MELNLIRSDAYTSIAEAGHRALLVDETALSTAIHETTIELSLWFDEWSSIASSEPNLHQKSLALLNLGIQHEWALITLHLKAVSTSGIENIAIMTAFQTDMVRKAKEAAVRHLQHLLEASTSPSLSSSSASNSSPSTAAPTYLNTFRWTMDYVWAKGAFSVLLVLKLAILLRDPIPAVMALLRDAHQVLEELKKVTIGHIPYYQILQTSIEKCEAALTDLASGATTDVMEAGRGAQDDFQRYAPNEFVFEWDFPGLHLKHMPLGWQDLFVDIDNLF